MICKQREVANILKSLLLSSFRFRVFFGVFLSKKEPQTQLSDFCVGLNRTDGLPGGGEAEVSGEAG